MFNLVKLSATQRIWLVSLSVLAMAGLVYFTNLTYESIWFDEAYSAIPTQLTFPRIIEFIRGDTHPPLYYLALKVWTMLFGDGLVALRAFSALAGVALVALAWPARRALGDRAALYFALLALCTPAVYAMAHEVRMYSWAIFWVTGAVVFGYLAVRENKLADWVGLGLFSLGTFYTHYYAMIAVGLAHVLLSGWILLFHRNRFVPYAIMVAVVSVLYLPWLFMFLRQFQSVSRSFWITSINFNVVLSALMFPFTDKFSMLMAPVFSGPLGQAGIYLSFLLAWAALIGGLIYALGKKQAEAPMVVVAGGVYLLTFVVAIGVSLAIRPLLTPRYMVVLTGPLLLAVAYGLAKLPARLGVAGLALWVLFSLPVNSMLRTQRFNGPANEMAAYLKDKVQPTDVFIYNSLLAMGPAAYHFPRNQHLLAFSTGLGNFPMVTTSPRNSVLLAGRQTLWVINQMVMMPTQTKNCADTEFLHFTEERDFTLVPSWFAVALCRAEIVAPLPVTPATTAGTGNLNIKLHNIHSDEGVVRVGLFTHRPVTDPAQADQLLSAPITQGQAEVTFSNLPYGEYAVVAYHDENNNNVVDMNPHTGGPAEGVGGSLNFGPVQSLSELTFEKYAFQLAAPELAMRLPVYCGK